MNDAVGLMKALRDPVVEFVLVNATGASGRARGGKFAGRVARGRGHDHAENYAQGGV